MHDEALRERHASTHQHCRPDDRVEPDDVLPDDVHVRRPEAAKGFRWIDAIDAANIVDQRIEPHIHHMRLPFHFLLRALHPPSEGAPADGKVPQLDGSQPLEDLSAILLRLYELLVLLDVLHNGGLVFRELEEKARLRHFLQRRTRARVLVIPLLGLLVSNEALLTDEIPSLVTVEEDVAYSLALLPHRTSHHLMAIGRCAHVEVVRDVQSLIQGFEAIAVAVADRERREALLLRLGRNLLPMLVRTRHEEDVLAPQAVMPCEAVSAERLVGVTDVRPTIAVVDRRGDIIPPSRVAARQACGTGTARRRCRRRCPPVLDNRRLTVDSQRLLLFARSPTLLGSRFGLPCGPLVEVRMACAEGRKVAVPSQDVRELLPIWNPVNLRESCEVLSGRMA
mmetsp:Transcript_91559/g.203199  ORF Transcript_91559/g.203199 Transcript_91559/m.203199 type:complete len:395 (-) Transcript_91559:177-1361(-)